MKNIYWERQKGGLCRKHSLNAYFGYNRISTQRFMDYCKEYSKYITKKYDVEVDVSANDVVMSNDIGIMSYIVKKEHGVHCIHFPMNNITSTVNCYGINFHKWLNGCDFMFSYNHDHIWGIKKYNGDWFRVDSMGGVSRQNVNNLCTEKNIGLIFPRGKETATDDYNMILSSIMNYLTTRKTNWKNVDAIRENVASTLKNGGLLGEIETLLGSLMEVLEVAFEDDIILISYGTFLRYFEKNKKDHEFIREWFPRIIHRILRRGKLVAT